MKKRRVSISMRRRLFLIMLAVSIIPTMLITAIASVNTYRGMYADTIQFNSQGMNWAHEQLQQFADEMKNLFYAMEFDPEYKEAVIDWYNGNETLLQRSVIREMLVSHLNRSSFLSSLDLHVQGAGTSVLAERAGVVMGDGAAQLPFPRPESLQTNLFFKYTGDSLKAVHNIHRFEDRQLLAQQTAGIKPVIFNDIISSISLFDKAAVVILNDEMELLVSLGAAELSMDSVREKLAGIDQPETARNQEVRYGETGGDILFSTYTPDTKLSIVTIIPRNEIVKSVMPTIYTGIAVGLLSLVGAVLLSAFLSRVISRPVERLAERVKNIQMQRLILEKEDDTGDEVRVLEHHISLFVEKIRQLIRSEYVFRLQAKNAQIHALQAQINPHFLHNTLQLIGSISLAGENPAVYTISSALSDLLRYSMDYENDFVTIEDEIAHLENYFLIQKQRFAERFSVDINLDHDAKVCRIPRLLIQPIVENSFSHGFSTMSGLWKLSITAYVDEAEKVHVIIRDNGVGMTHERVRELNSMLQERYADDTVIAGGGVGMEGSIGLVNVHDRIRLTFSDDDGLEIDSRAGQWTEVHMHFSKRSRHE